VAGKHKVIRCDYCGAEVWRKEGFSAREAADWLRGHLAFGEAFTPGVCQSDFARSVRVRLEF
jgi:hypothetical protein